MLSTMTTCGVDVSSVVCDACDVASCDACDVSVTCDVSCDACDVRVIHTASIYVDRHVACACPTRRPSYT